MPSTAMYKRKSNYGTQIARECKDAYTMGLFQDAERLQMSFYYILYMFQPTSKC